MSRRGTSAALAFDPLAAMATQQRRRSTPERFWARVDQSAGTDACWLWTGRLDVDGYGRTKWCGRDIGAHRIAFALAKGPIEAERVVMHACDNPVCCNPAHLSAGTLADNNRDMRAKGRNRSGERPRGERNPRSKLTDAKVRELRAAWRAGETIKNIAARTGLAEGTVHPMLHGDTWAHVLDVEAAS